MASTTSSTSGFFSSPRGQRALYWISGIVFLAGVVAIITVYATRGNSTTSSPPATSPPAQTKDPLTKGTTATKIKASPQALQTARQFLETAVLRKNLAASYKLVGPFLRGGLTLKQWKTGNITVVPYPANNAKRTALVVKYSHPSDLLLSVSLVPKPGVKIKPLGFNLELNKIKGRWLVQSFTPQYQHQVRLGGQ